MAEPETVQLQHSEETYVSKLTIKAMGATPAKVVGLPDGNKWPLARIFGKVSDVKTKESQTIAGSIEVAFIGNFEGINLETGEVFRSGRLYLPKGISELMEKTFEQLRKQDKNADVSFAFEIRSVKASNPIGYSYEAQALQSAQKMDELAHLRNSIKQLPVAGATFPEKKLTDGKSKK